MTWTQPKYTTPQAFGAVGDGVTDDTVAIQTWINTLDAAAGSAVGVAKPMTVYDGGGRTYAVSSTIKTPARYNIIMRDIGFIAIGSAWTSTDYVLQNLASFSKFTNIYVDCNKVTNGIQDQAGRTRWHDPMVFRMTPNWASVGFDIPDYGPGDVRVSGAWIMQWDMSDAEFGIFAKRTATGMHVRNSDCKIQASNIDFCKVGYDGSTGSHTLDNVHICGQKAIPGDTDPTTYDWTTILWGYDSNSGSLMLHDVELDIGVANIYGPSAKGNVNIICNSPNYMFKPFLRFWSGSGGSGEPNSDITIEMRGLTGLAAGANAICDFPNRGGSYPDWDAQIQTASAAANSNVMSFGGYYRNSMRIFNKDIELSTNLNSPSKILFSTLGQGVESVQGLQMVNQDYPQPGATLARANSNVAWVTGQTIAIGNVRVNAGHFYQATTAGTTGATAPTHTSGTVSDGGVSWLYLTDVNSFGVAGAGLYCLTGGVWVRQT